MQKKKKSIKGKLTVLLVLVLAAGAGLYFYGPLAPRNSSAQDANNFAAVTKGSIEESVTSQGKLQPKQYVDVGAQVSGQLKTLAVALGQDVKAGDLIAEIDPEVYKSQVKGDEARLKTLQAQRDQQQAQLLQSQQKLQRNADLYKAAAVSKEVYQDAETAVKIAQSEVKALEAQIEEQQSTLEGDKAKLNYSKIYAPINGTVVAQSARQGQTLNANQTAPTIVQIANLDVMTVQAQVAEADISKIKTGMPVYFTTLGSTRRWQGSVRQILPAPEVINDVVLYDVLVDVENKDHQLMSGMTTQMFFELGKADNVLLIPVAALGRRLEKQDTDQGEAYIVHMAGVAEGKKVYIGLMDRTNAEVRAGLNEGDKVALPAAQGASGASSGASGARGGQQRAGGMRGTPRL